MRNHFLRTTAENTSRRIIGFAPSRQNDDVSPLVVALAILLAQSERRTLVIDLHRKAPRVASLLGVEHGDGLGQWLRMEKPLRQCVGYTAIKELAVLGLGKTSPDLDDLLGRRALSTELPALLEDWDFILIASPPIRFDWTMMLVLPSDSPLVITADYHKGKADDVKNTMRRAQNSQWPIEGVVLQNCPHRVAGIRAL